MRCVCCCGCVQGFSATKKKGDGRTATNVYTKLMAHGDNMMLKTNKFTALLRFCGLCRLNIPCRSCGDAQLSRLHERRPQAPRAAGSSLPRCPHSAFIVAGSGWAGSDATNLISSLRRLWRARCSALQELSSTLHQDARDSRAHFKPRVRLRVAQHRALAAPPAPPLDLPHRTVARGSVVRGSAVTSGMRRANLVVQPPRC